MASVPVTRDREALVRPISTAASTLASDNHSLVSDFRRAFVMMKDIAVELEKENKTEMVKEIEADLTELLNAYDECALFSTVLQSTKDIYEPGPQLTDFNQLFKNEITKLKAGNSSNRQKLQYVNQFREAVWNVHHPGQPMPGEEQEEIVMTSTHNVLLNNKCPVSGKSVTELEEPVRSMDCKHVYEKKAIMHYMNSSKALPIRCPIPGCRGTLRQDKVICDGLLLADIEDHRSLARETMAEVVEDFTELDDD
ncbi:hypothetical protein V2J09_023710 [Rumex salicifolius]